MNTLLVIDTHASGLGVHSNACQSRGTMVLEAGHYGSQSEGIMKLSFLPGPGLITPSCGQSKVWDLG